MKIYAIPIPEAKFRSIPEDERVFFIQAAHLGNELSFLHKLLFFTNRKSELDTEQRGFYAQRHFVTRMLVGTLFEGWRMFEKSLFGSTISKKYESQLEEPGKSDLGELKKYFGKKNIIGELRNKFAFHYDADRIRSELSLGSAGDPSHIYLATVHGNSLYYVAEEIVGLAMLQHIKDVVQANDREDAMKRLYSDAISVSRKFLSVISSCLVVFAKTYLGQSFEEMNAEEVDIGDPVAMDEVSLPFFVARST